MATKRDRFLGGGPQLAKEERCDVKAAYDDAWWPGVDRATGLLDHFHITRRQSMYLYSLLKYTTPFTSRTVV